MKLFSASVLAVFMFNLSACTPAEAPSTDIAPLQKHLADAQKRLAELELEIRAAGDEPNAMAPLVEERSLIQSRVLRTKEKLKDLGALPAEAEAGGGGGGHH
ncbi:hypothetical protein K2X33_06790 [bacterium]|nr:hypothetical protein [bacterium]